MILLLKNYAATDGEGGLVNDTLENQIQAAIDANVREDYASLMTRDCAAKFSGWEPTAREQTAIEHLIRGLVEQQYGIKYKAKVELANGGNGILLRIDTAEDAEKGNE